MISAAAGPYIYAHEETDGRHGVLLLLCAPAHFAQERSYGKPSELKGLKRVYVDAGAGRKSRERIVDEAVGKALRDVSKG